MSTTNSSNSSVTNHNSFVVESYHDTNISWKKCNFSWTIDKYYENEAKNEKLKSAPFSAVDDDFVWYLEFSTYLGSKIIDIGKRHSIFLYPNSNQDLEKYVAISGKVQFSLVRCDRNSIVESAVRIKSFKIQSQSDDKMHAPTAIGFVDFIDASKAGGYVDVHDKLTISCVITYVKHRSINPCERYDSNLRIDFERLLADKHFSDVIISVEGKNYPVHKGILVARSSVFNTMFRSDMQESTTNHVDIPDISQNVFEEMLLYIYTGKIKNYHLAFELLPVANKYDLKGLKVMCEEELFKKLSKDNAIKTLIQADTHQAIRLKTQVLQFIKLHAPYTNIKNTEIWNVLTTFHPNLMKDMLAILLE